MYRLITSRTTIDHENISLKFYLRMRWIAIGLLLVAVTVGWHMNLLTGWIWLFVVIGIMTLANMALHFSTGEKKGAHLGLQSILDIVSITATLYFSGGVDENPFLILFTFHVIVAGMIFPAGKAYVAAAYGLIAGGTVTVLERFRVIPHYTMTLWEHAEQPHTFCSMEDVFSTGLWVVAFGVGLFGVAYLTTTITKSLRKAQKEREELQALVRQEERMAMFGEVTAGILHEINNPLEGVMNAISMLKKEEFGKLSRQELRGIVEDGLNRISEITKKMLVLARREKGSKRLVDVRELISDSTTFLSHQVKQKQIEMKVAVDADVEPIIVDPVGMSEVLMNLVKNSIDAVEPYKGKIEIGAASVNGTIPPSVRITVRDNGCGIPTELREKIFKPFFTTKPVGKGSGLGLAIASKIVHENNGTIIVSSDGKTGTEFAITIPYGRR